MDILILKNSSVTHRWTVKPTLLQIKRTCVEFVGNLTQRPMVHLPPFSFVKYHFTCLTNFCLWIAEKTTQFAMEGIPHTLYVSNICGLPGITFLKYSYLDCVSILFSLPNSIGSYISSCKTNNYIVYFLLLSFSWNRLPLPGYKCWDLFPYK